jgi:serine/threonine protein kinase
VSELLGGVDSAFIAELIDSHICPEDLTPDDMPSEVGPYEVIEPLGRGRGSQVYLARDPDSERAVALKHFERGSPCSRRELKALTRRLSSLEERAIVPIRAILEVEERIVVCMDYVTEATLAERELALEEGLRCLERVARACNSAHQAGLVHGDLRPGNILLGPQPRILDFGVASVFAGGKEPFGAPAYMAPEVARGEEPAPASDVYSLGAILYELLCGVPPYGLDDDKEILIRLRGTEAPRSPRSRAPEVPRALERIALQALARDPRGRQESAGALAEDLATWSQEYDPPVEVSGVWAWVALGAGVPLAAILGTSLVGGELPAPRATPRATQTVSPVAQQSPPKTNAESAPLERERRLPGPQEGEARRDAEQRDRRPDERERRGPPPGGPQGDQRGGPQPPPGGPHSGPRHGPQGGPGRGPRRGPEGGPSHGPRPLGPPHGGRRGPEGGGHPAPRPEEGRPR